MGQPGVPFVPTTEREIPPTVQVALRKRLARLWPMLVVLAILAITASKNVRPMQGCLKVVAHCEATPNKSPGI
jgi:hypothetical protein